MMSKPIIMHNNISNHWKQSDADSYSQLHSIIVPYRQTIQIKYQPTADEKKHPLCHVNSLCFIYNL
jgi:hypothetical protein